MEFRPFLLSLNTSNRKKINILNAQSYIWWHIMASSWSTAVCGNAYTYYGKFISFPLLCMQIPCFPRILFDLWFVFLTLSLHMHGFMFCVPSIWFHSSAPCWFGSVALQCTYKSDSTSPTPLPWSPPEHCPDHQAICDSVEMLGTYSLISVKNITGRKLTERMLQSMDRDKDIWIGDTK